MTKLVLGIETSCDDTSLALISGESGAWKNAPTILSHLSYGQGELLKQWGGVVPELAARNHMEKLPVLLKSISQAAQIELKAIDAIAVTTLPGLLGPLMTGMGVAKSLSLFLQKPIVPINHLFAHLEAIHLTERVSYPYLGILVSGGHTLFCLVTDCHQLKVIGSTKDDAAGEAFDKGGKMLGLGYPAGHLIDRHALEGNPSAFEFPIGLKTTGDCMMSFSGVKTSLRLALEKLDHFEKSEKFKNPDGSFNQLLQDLCASYQEAIVDALVWKTKYALRRARKELGQTVPIVVGGGVACNSRLRKKLQERYSNTTFVKPEYCTDNGAMIAGLGLRQFQQAVAFPQCLELSSTSRFIQKGQDFPA